MASRMRRGTLTLVQQGRTSHRGGVFCPVHKITFLKMTLGPCKDTTAIPAHLEGATDTRVHQGEATSMRGLQGDLTTVHLDGARYLTTGSALDVGILIVLAWFLLGMTASLSIDCDITLSIWYIL